MEQLEGRVAVVTGAGSGIGEGIARACAGAGMKLVIADVDAVEAERVAADLRGAGGQAVAAPCDVTDRTALEALADATWKEFGGCHLLCNNAGVMVQGSLAEATDADWSWVLDVNVHGVVNGLQAFVPRMIEQGGRAHIVNTASKAGLCLLPDLGVYTTSKFAVVGLSESLRADLAPHGIGVSVLCPGGVDTRIQESDRNRPDGVRAERPGLDMTEEEIAAARAEHEIMAPEEVGRITLDAVRRDALYAVTHPSWRPLVEARFEALLEAFDAAASRTD